MTGSAVLYVRVSTEDQDLAGQERELRVEAARRGWEVVFVYAEKVSGTGRAERKEYDRLLRDAREAGRPWGHLLVWALDRFSREETFTRATQVVLDLEKLGTFKPHPTKLPYGSVGEPMSSCFRGSLPTVGRTVRT